LNFFPFFFDFGFARFGKFSEGELVLLEVVEGSCGRLKVEKNQLNVVLVPL